jgi:hypothetical protein
MDSAREKGVLCNFSYKSLSQPLGGSEEDTKEET